MYIVYIVYAYIIRILKDKAFELQQNVFNVFIVLTIYSSSITKDQQLKSPYNEYRNQIKRRFN